MGNNFFFKQIFLRGKFGDQVLEESFLRGGNFASKNILEEFFYVKFHCEKKYGEQKCLAANSWEEKLGSKFFWMKTRGAKWGTNFFLKKFSWEEILGSMFWRSRFFLGGNFASKIFGECFAS